MASSRLTFRGDTGCPVQALPTQLSLNLEWTNGTPYFGLWTDDLEMYGTGYDFSGNVVQITDPYANWWHMVDSQNYLMASFWPDYTNVGVVFQWFRWN